MWPFVKEMIEEIDKAGKLHTGILDEAVHEAFSVVASSVNNEGEERQIEYLHEILGKDEAKAIIFSCLPFKEEKSNE